MARKRPRASDGRPKLLCLDGERPDTDGPLLTRSDARALRRSAAVTHALLAERLEGLRAAGLRSP